MYKDYKNDHLVEVNCGFQFLDDTSNWDNTHFGQFYDLIKTAGFTEKIERKGIHITINDDENSTNSKIASQEIEEQVIFKNSVSGLAILIAKNKISFHSIGKYTNWEKFSKDFILPNLEKYFGLGLGQGKYRLNLLYLNKFQISENLKTSDYISFFNEIQNCDDLKEIETNFKRVFRYKNLTLLVKGNRVQNNSLINLECGSFFESSNLNENNINEILSLTHEPIRDLFENSISTKLKENL